MRRIERSRASGPSSRVRPGGWGAPRPSFFAREGASVALLDAQDAAGSEVEAEIRALGGEVGFWRTDVTSELEVRTSVDAAAEAFGGLDVLVNCAGIIGADKPTHEVSEAEWDAVFAVDVKGSIVNFSSIYGLIGNDEFTLYNVAKGAVNMQTKQDAATYGQHSIGVSTVNPSTVLTPLVEGIAAEYPGRLPAYEEMMTARQSLRRLGRSVDVANSVLFLASDEADWITGVTLPVDGGYTAR